MPALVAENLDEWSSAFDRELESLVRDAERELVDLAEDIGRRERSSGPRGEGEHAVDTIEVTQGRSGTVFFVDVGPDASGFYLAFYEFGTHHQPPRPFMRPSIAQAIASWR